MMRPLLTLLLGLSLVCVSHTEAIAGGKRRITRPSGLPTTPDVRRPHGVDGPTASLETLELDLFASFTADCPEQCTPELQTIWQQKVDRTRTSLGEDGFRTSLQKRGVNLDEFLSAEPRADFVSVARIDYDRLYRSWPRPLRGNTRATRQWEREEERNEQTVNGGRTDVELTFEQISMFLLCAIGLLLLLGGVVFVVATLLWLASRLLVALVCGARALLPR
jgi:hypothetical protein